MDDAIGGTTQLARRKTGLVRAIDVHFLHEHNERRLSRLADLLVRALRFVVIDRRVVAQ